MTEYWVSQGNKWCNFCKIYIANNPLSIRTHELGQRHKDNVAKRLANMRKENAAKEKEQKEAARALEQIEAKAKQSYQKDLAAFQESIDLNVHALQACDKNPNSAASSNGWEYDSTSGYYFNKSNGYHYDPNSGMYYSNAIGKWVAQEEAFPSSQASTGKPHNSSELRNLSLSVASSRTENKSTSKNQGGAPPGQVVSSTPNPMRSVKGVPSSITVNKRKRGEKPKAISKEEEAALKAREAARKRTEEREKPLLGLYKSY